MAGDPSNNPGCLSLEPTRHCLPRCSGGRPGLPGTRSWRPPHTAMPIAEGYGTLAWRGHSRCPLLPPAEPHRGGAIERLQMLPHTPRGEARRLVPNFEASPHEGFPGDSRETPTPSAALAAPHRPRGSTCLPRRGRCRCPPGARRGAGRAGRALGGGPGDSCRRSGRAGKRGYWRRRWRRREPQTGSSAGTPGPPRRRGPPGTAQAPSRRPPAAASPYAGRPRHFRHTHAHSHTHTHTRARERGFRCRCQRQQAAAEPGLRRRSSGSSGREGHTHTQAHTPTHRGPGRNVHFR